MFIRRFHHVLRNEAGAGAAAGGEVGGGAAGAAGDGGAGAAGAGGGDGAAAGAGAAAGTALAAGAAAAGGAGGGAGAGGAAAGGTDPLAWLPEKYRVLGEDGKAINYEASARKVAEAHGHLERRMGSGEAPPAKPEDYKINVPEALKGKVDAEALTKDAGFKADLASLHAAGASQKLVDTYVATALQRGLAMREAMPVLAASECEATLRQQDGWKSDAEYAKHVGLAFNAGKSIFGADFDGILKDYGNDPRVIRGLASIGREMQEDRGPSPEAQAQLQDNMDTLMSSPAYLNASDPKHADTLAKVTALTKQLHGEKPLASGKTISFKSG